MGIDRGFDLFPPLTESTEDKWKWEAFLDEVKRKYENDDKVEINMDGKVAVKILQGEHPQLLKNGHQFRRFSAKISGSHAENVEKYLYAVGVIAKRHFGRRIHLWDQLGYDDCDMCYTWGEVYDAEK